MTPRLNSAARVYIGLVVATGIGAVLHSVHSLAVQPLPYQWLMLALLTLLSGSFTVRIPGVPARLSVSDTFVFASAAMFGPAAATMLVVLDTLVISFWRGSHSHPSRILFNVAAGSAAIWVASHSFYIASGIAPLFASPQPVLFIVFPLLGLAAIYFLLNSWLVAFAIALQQHRSVTAIWKHNFWWLSLKYYSGASVAALLLPYLIHAEQYVFLYVVGVLLPVLLLFYLTFKTSFGRVEDANRHISELNTLYLSTIKTLAMAIDAKDQITHGHIRRVQQYAVGLARHLGISDHAHISAIEAASLLHDMGKLAVPEYILNKPGKLTAAEFEKMKLHASVGADILAAITFPYPVVPIVRHHHENWDGSGYPDGLRGTAIPLGARILSVVDCFDALTSDRPYRPKLSDAEAVHILLERRGSMYDPLIVDAFLTIHSQMTASMGDSVASDTRRGGADVINHTVSDDSPTQLSGFADIASSTEEMLVLYELASSLTGSIALADAGDVIAKHLRRILPASTCVFYIYDLQSDDLTAAHAVGDNAAHFYSLRIPRGQRLAGWVAANRRTIVNSDPGLDLGEIARTMKPRLCSALSTPLIVGEHLLGVLTLYSTAHNAFNEDHRRVIEVVARQVYRTVKHAVDFERHRFIYLRDHLTGLPNLKHLERLVSSGMSFLDGFSLVLVRVRPFRSIGGICANVVSDTAMGHIADAVREGLRGGDLLFRHGSDEFLVLLPQTDVDAAQVVAGRICQRIAANLIIGEGNCTFDVTLGISSLPSDGTTVQTLVEAARTRAHTIVVNGFQAFSVH